MALSRLERRLKLKKSIAKKLKSTTRKHRLVVYRSNKEIYAQICEGKKTLFSVSSLSKEFANLKGTKTEIASEVGKAIASKALGQGIKEVYFDRNGFLYHGRVKALADGARQNGLIF
ncbi:MAG: 50S ribosomal protein L18 [Bacteroidia bacterium]|nr:50S ribosomal protein L18 [Bacteroidia bacterium]